MFICPLFSVLVEFWKPNENEFTRRKATNGSEVTTYYSFNIVFGSHMWENGKFTDFFLEKDNHLSAFISHFLAFLTLFFQENDKKNRFPLS